ncbi:MAG: hypothetical protein LBC97_12075 [Bifidobacteriaceae bacterium]|nr:hypothetical protein [Bifidobacteriaceae bacterium]
MLKPLPDGPSAGGGGEDLPEALRQTQMMISKLDRALARLPDTAKPQRTLAERRINALRVAEGLICKQIDKSPGRLMDVELSVVTSTARRERAAALAATLAKVIGFPPGGARIERYLKGDGQWRVDMGARLPCDDVALDSLDLCERIANTWVIQRYSPGDSLWLIYDPSRFWASYQDYRFNAVTWACWEAQLVAKDEDATVTQEAG